MLKQCTRYQLIPEKPSASGLITCNIGNSLKSSRKGGWGSGKG